MARAPKRWHAALCAMLAACSQGGEALATDRQWLAGEVFLNDTVGASANTTGTTTTAIRTTTPTARHKPCGSETFNLALGRVPTGSSSSPEGGFAGATDGAVADTSWWQAHTAPVLPGSVLRQASAPGFVLEEEERDVGVMGEVYRGVGDYPAFLTIDLDAPAVVSHMVLKGGKPGFRSLWTYRSDDARKWTLVRSESLGGNCEPLAETRHEGWPEPTRFLRIQMQDRCGDTHFGQFTLAEWEVHGWYEEQMALKYVRSWPHCADLGPCFSHKDLADAKAECLAKPACDGLSFSAEVVRGGRGSGCYKTQCTGQAPAPLGRGTHGYWVKRRGCAKPSQPTHVDTALGLEVCGR